MSLSMYALVNDVLLQLHRGASTCDVLRAMIHLSRSMSRVSHATTDSFSIFRR